jgi:hypothetical protein
LARDSGSLPVVLAWSEAVGSRLADVVALDLHKHLTPDAVDRGQLEALLALNDKTAIARLTLLSSTQLSTLLTLADANLAALANLLTPDELAWLSGELPSLSAVQRNQLVARILSQPDVIDSLQRLGSIEQLAGAANLDDAITFLLSPQQGLDYLVDGGAVITGAVTPQLFWAKYGLWPTVGGGVGALLILLVGLRLVWGFGGWMLRPFRGFGRRDKER